MNKNLPRDVFLYFLSIITLVVSAVSFGVLVFQYINIYFPDALVDYYKPASSYFSSIRHSLAFVIVVFPVYVWASRFLRLDIEANPEKRDLKIRKWLLYLTVFVAGLVIIGDLVALLNTFLEGEITSRFILKILTIFFIAGSAFYYYFKELKLDDSKKDWNIWSIRVFPLIVIIVVLTVVVSGFFVAGSPSNRRMERFDERRIQDLSIIQNQIINYWQNKNVLPDNLNELTDEVLGVFVPVDPKTSESYEYFILGPLSFELCSTFETKSNNNIKNNIRVPIIESAILRPRGQNYNWQHDIGRTCFESIIDPDFLRIEKPLPL
ncbi:MAG: hypothetical protein COV30_00030 [Candidatus Yanofskybacteria bacterium CG10_big_fil_rev_8_21_14_0_10_37_15]|uniref:DUF5671 domain-containing protein n=1 Tax=Candidatus Yanofskybacteria bacterium CG10_big_fil_rev_8_21_14_0_10_37_15 TaxID=1975097 RepID=A0A2H0R6I0_9BACT|nr:MAG: hypothetical protein COV30_00030 [Candidatus Yanofskybacteria bacterium CG10_big_fil_rev_8_21_14_0_10_37_15]